MQSWDFFFRRQNNDPSKNLDVPCNVIRIDLPDGTALLGAVLEVLKRGGPKGDHHSGLVEVQNDGDGIWVAADGKRIWGRAKTAAGIKLRTLTFTSWDE